MRLVVISFALLLGLSLCAWGESPVSEDDWGRSLVAYFKDDLNGDNALEHIKLIAPIPFYTNVSDLRWVDSAGIVLVITDALGKEVFWDEVTIPFQKINNVSIEDVNEDGLKEILITIEEEVPHTKDVYIYGWCEGKYALIEKDSGKTIIERADASYESKFWNKKYILILKSTENYQEALGFAREAGEKLGLKFKHEHKNYTQERGIYFTDELDDELYAGKYYPRRYFSDYISLENSSHYQGFAPDYIIVVAGIFSDKDEADQALDEIKKTYNDAYIKGSKLWMGCIH